MQTTRIGILVYANKVIASTWEMLARNVFRYVVPVNIKQTDDGRLIYTCLSEKFDELAPGDAYPVYTPHITMASGQADTTTFSRIREAPEPPPPEPQLPPNATPPMPLPAEPPPPEPGENERP